MLYFIYKITFNRYLLSAVSIFSIGTNLIFAQEENLQPLELYDYESMSPVKVVGIVENDFSQEENLQPLKLYDYESMNPGFVDMFYKSKTAYLYKGEKFSCVRY